MKKSNPFFKKRIPEPEEMDNIENDSFIEMAENKRVLWFGVMVDHIFSFIKLREGVVVDIGSGPGFLVQEIARRSKFFSVFGIDLSSQMVREAKKRNFLFENIIFKKADAVKMPFKTSSVDLIVSRDSFHHFEDPAKVLKEIKRILKPGGIFYLQDLRRDLPFRLLKQAIPPKTVFQKLQFYSARAAYTKKEFKKIAENAGFKVLKLASRRINQVLIRKYCKKNITIEQLAATLDAHFFALLSKK